MKGRVIKHGALGTAGGTLSVLLLQRKFQRSNLGLGIIEIGVVGVMAGALAASYSYQAY